MSQMEVEIKYIIPGGASEAAQLAHALSRLAGSGGSEPNFEDNYLL